MNDKNRTQQRDDNAIVLIVDDEPPTIRLMLEILARRGMGARLAATRKAAMEAIDKSRCDLVFISARLADAPEQSGGFALLNEIRATAPELPVVMMAAPVVCNDAAERFSSMGVPPMVPDHGQDGDPKRNVSRLGTHARATRCPCGHTTHQAVRAIQAGCREFLLKPLDPQTVENLLETLLPSRQVATAVAAHEGNRCLYQIVGKSPKLIQTVTLAERIAPTSVPVLISGESGTGKELVALLIHHKSLRALGPFVRVNCAALSDTLLESELFGHEKGAFTGAYAQRKGRFEMAHGGTLLLDEITETPPRFQAKLLRILEQQEFERVGGNENIKVNVRVISTTNRDLFHEVQMGRFRQDLYYRLSAARIVLAPLRERREDLPELVWHFVNLYARETHRQVRQLDPTMMEILARYDWPGNIRQLRNVVLTSLILGAGPTLSLADVSWLFDEIQQVPQHGAAAQPPLGSIGKADGLADGFVVDLDGPSASVRLPLPPSAIRNPKSDMAVGGIPLDELERRAILETLRQTSGNQTRAAKVLGISDRTLREKMRRYRRQECLQTVS